ncbi:MAG: winged helix-turn-helix domain-containing protein [Anaerolineae bacterium]|nr:winged helix-turn-helix domain-containing protein [Anaerolineae bacterium]
MTNRQIQRAANPYTYSRPVSGLDQFFGREKELAYVFDCIRKRACVNVVGERRIGKTSFLKYLLHPEVQERYNPDDDGAVYLYLDPEIMTPKDPRGFYAEILAQPAMRRQLLAKCGDESQIPEAIAQIAAGVYPETDTAAELPPNLGSIGERGMRKALDLIRPCRLVMLVDEFEIIARCGGFAFPFFEFLRGLSQSYEISFVLATSIPLAQCCPNDVRSSPFPNIFQRLVLGSFCPAEFAGYIEWTSSQGAAPLAEVQEHIYGLSGGFPYLVQMACTLYYWAWSQGETLGPALFPRIQYRFQREARSHFERVWGRHLSDEERDALSEIASHGPVSEPYSDAVWALHERGHLVEGRIASQAFAAFVAEVSDEEQQDNGTEFGNGVPEPNDDESSSDVDEMGIWVDLTTELVYVDGQLLEDQPTKLEYKLLTVLWESIGETTSAVCSFYQVVLGVWGDEYIPDVDDQRISALVRRLRKKVEPNGRPWKYIAAVHGRGLRLEHYAHKGPSGS